MARRLIFSDIDGTLVHYAEEGQSEPAEGSLRLPPSTTGKQGVISAATLHQVAALRNSGVKFVLLSGARTSTVLQRLPFLPASDCIISENGGRIFFTGSPLPTALPLTEDVEWRATFDAVVGPASQEGLPPAERQGVLWDFYRQLSRQGWSVDAANYSTAFRLRGHAASQFAEGAVETGMGSSAEDQHAKAAGIQAVIAARPPSLACSFNLGTADFYPASSGKEKAAAYIMRRWGVAPENAVFLCDDDNDMLLAKAVGRAFLPSITSPSVEAAVQAQPGRFFVASLANRGSTAGTEEVLTAVQAHFGIEKGVS